jgi:hypothetical protein
MHDDDRLLREQLRGADPARDLAPLPPMWLDHRMEQIMSDPTSASAAPAPAPSAPSAPRRAWLAVAIAATGLAAAAAIAVPLVLGGSPTVEPLALPDGAGLAGGSCLPVTADGLLDQEQAFAARVLSVEGETVTLEVTERFAGDVADRVTVPQVDPMASDFSQAPFAVGDTYLVVATDGSIAGCGLSGPESPELRALYSEAFSG